MPVELLEAAAEAGNPTERLRRSGPGLAKTATVPTSSSIALPKPDEWSANGSGHPDRYECRRPRLDGPLLKINDRSSKKTQNEVGRWKVQIGQKRKDCQALPSRIRPASARLGRT